MMTPAANAGADDLAILCPDRTVTIAGVTITMREYRFVEAMRLGAPLAAITTALTAAVAAGAAATVTAFDGVFVEHADVMPMLMATACDQPESWVRGLSDKDGARLLQVWWSANAGFFSRRVVRHLLDQAALESAGQMFMQPSPAPATGPTVSSPTRVVN